MNHQVSIYNPNGTSFQQRHSSFDNESHIYASIEDSMVYTHLLRKGAEMGIYVESDTHQPVTGPTVPREPSVCRDSGGDDLEVSVYQPFPSASQQPPTLPNRPVSREKLMVDNDIYCSEEDLCPRDGASTELGLRLEPEGGN